MQSGGYFTDRARQRGHCQRCLRQASSTRSGRLDSSDPEQQREDFLIVGTAIASEFTYLLGPAALVPDPEHLGVFYIKRTYAEDAFDFDGAANEVLGRLASVGGNGEDRKRDTTLVLRQAERLLEPYGVITTTPLAEQVSNQSLSQEIDGLRIFALFMPISFLAVAALVLNVLLSRLADQQRMVVGTLKAARDTPTPKCSFIF